jgi:deoxyhypusine synthase
MLFTEDIMFIQYGELLVDYRKSELLKRHVEDLHVKKGMSVSELISAMKNIGGFSAQNMVHGIGIIDAMLRDRDSFNFLSFPANIISTGVRGLIADSVGYFDALMTTGGTLDHDLARAHGGKYSVGSFEADDSRLHGMSIYRLGNVFIEHKEYGEAVEQQFTEIMNDIYSGRDYRGEYSPSELIYEFGKRIKDRNSILYQSYKHKVPVFCPGILDGAFGTQLAIFSQDHKFKLNLLKDELLLSNLMFDNKVTGALMLGGGISKHHVIWWNQFKGGLDYAVYITTASQYDGSLSGARLTEAVSWGKVKEKAKYATIDGDVTIILPLIFAHLGLVMK